jgi:4-carboxymuconolactone decarboxylase
MGSSVSGCDNAGLTVAIIVERSEHARNEASPDSASVARARVGSDAVSDTIGGANQDRAARGRSPHPSRQTEGRAAGRRTVDRCAPRPDRVHRVAQGPDTLGWPPIEAELLRLADQLVRNSFVNDATWKSVSAAYDMYHMMDAVMTVTQFTTESLLDNSWGVQPDDWATAAGRIPTDVSYRVVVPEREPPLKTARVEPLPGTGLAIGRTFARYPKLAAARTGSGYVNRGSKLAPRYREMMILRTGWNCQSEYEWAQHVGSVGRAREHGLDPVRIAQGATAPGWDPFEQTLLRVADELYRDSIVSDQTWNQLAARFDNTMITNVIISAANYRMVSMALNALGVAIDPGDEGFPQLP